MSTSYDAGVSGLDQLAIQVLAHQFVQVVTACRSEPYQRLVDQAGQKPQRCAADLFRGVHIETAAKHAERHKRSLVNIRQETPRAIENRSQTAMPVRHVAYRGGEKVHAALDLDGDLLARHHS